MGMEIVVFIHSCDFKRFSKKVGRLLITNKYHGRAALVEYSTNWLNFAVFGWIFNQFWFNIQPKAKIQNKNDVIIQGKKWSGIGDQSSSTV